MGFTLLAKDVKNAYFSGKSVDREIYLEPPRGGLPGLRPGQLLRARKAIYGFAEAARMFWLALKEHLESDGWEESRLEPALFYLREKTELVGILVTRDLPECFWRVGLDHPAAPLRPDLRERGDTAVQGRPLCR